MAQRIALIAFGTLAIAVFSGMSPGGASAQAQTTTSSSSSSSSTAASAPNGPPPEAIAACTGKTAGTTVSFTGRRGDTLTGVCQLDASGVLAARPTGGGPGGHGGPPPSPR